MRRRPRPAAVPAILFTLSLALGACTGAAPPMVVGEVAARPTPTPTPTPTPSPTPTPEPTPTPLPQADAIDVALTAVRVRSVDNGVLFGVPAVPPDQAAAQAGADAAVAELEHFLYSQFVSRSSLVSEVGLSSLIDPATIDPATRAAFGVLGRDDLLGTRDGDATAEADVQVDGTTVESVTLTYTATVELVLREAAGRVTQTGVLVLTPLGGPLVPVAWQPTTTFGGDLAAVLP